MTVHLATVNHINTQKNFGYIRDVFSNERFFFSFDDITNFTNPPDYGYVMHYGTVQASPNYPKSAGKAFNFSG